MTTENRAEVGPSDHEAPAILERDDSTNGASRQAMIAAERVNSFHRRRAAPNASEVTSSDSSDGPARHGER